ncbi:general secretion pathway protein I [Pseudomonas sp. NFACC23-1]|uniref:type II secretion system minor pseudopilin GspI n=1 Tax=unclassified Pseudomonas TaxID=196821 RepID=UPI000881A05F|nr:MULTISPECIES: type II secretion system minor pseudopilin GspI [unclassified Pseudomonas]SDB37883.1 general secretion pathway protein I [Pseudomonas sp. NFACC17-2]SEJ53872.1 general secretion pathway protein I [Pseudomonas sp. NFACC23-1]SFW71494.1 general secretion pathway protein I [Pseudomonas sp. NFACC16-2]
MADARGLAADCQGFTLLEVMVALAIFATLAAAVLSASQFVLKQSAGLEDRLFGAWLADNQLSELRLQAATPLGQQRLARRLDQRDWILQQRVAAARDPRLLRVEIQVSRAGSPAVVHRTTGWVRDRHE